MRSTSNLVVFISVEDRNIPHSFPYASSFRLSGPGQFCEDKDSPYFCTQMNCKWLSNHRSFRNRVPNRKINNVLSMSLVVVLTGYWHFSSSFLT